MCDCEKKCGCGESASTIRKKICVDIAGYDPDDVCNNKLVIKYADSCQVILGIDNCTIVTPTLPLAPTNGYVTDSDGGAYDCGNPILGWTESLTSGVTYTIREGATIIASGITTNSYTVTGATAGVHSYTVEAVNGVGSSSVLTINAFVAVCATAPGNITNLSVTDSGGGSYDCGAPVLNWISSPTATSYDIIEGVTLVANVTGTTYTFPTQPTVGSHTYTVIAKNGAGSASGVNITVTIIDCLTAPGNVSGTINVYNSGTAVSYTCGTGFDVDFTDVATATYYQLFEGATQIGSNSSTSNFVVTGQTVGSHTYTIKACNGAGCSTGTNFTVSVAACVTPSSAFITRDDFSYGNPAYTINNPGGETIIQTGMVLIGPYSNPGYSYYPDPTLTDTVQSYGTAMFRVFNPPMPPGGQCYTYRAFVTTNLGTTYGPSTSSSCQ